MDVNFKPTQKNRIGSMYIALYVFKLLCLVYPYIHITSYYNYHFTLDDNV